MNEAITIIDKQLDQMAKVFNVIPGEGFRLKDIDTMLIVQRKLEDSDLKQALTLFNEIFSKTDGTSLSDLCQSAVAYVRIKTLVENDLLDFDARSMRALIKEFKSQIVKINNIIHLSKVNAMAAEAYQKEEIKKTLVKNEAFLDAFEKEIESLEKKIDRIPIVEEKAEELVKKTSKPEKKSIPDTTDKKGVLNKVTQMLSARQEKKEVDSKLKTEEMKKSKTQCVEIPFYDHSLTFTEVIACKDIPLYVLVKRKNSIFFGLKKNVGKSSYDNSDHSLIELTEATDEFVQYMSADLLSGEFKLTPFTNSEKKSMRMYFNFMSWCFEKYIGISLTVQEYLKFKNYYNKVVLTMFDLEEKFRKDYYRALVLADNYVTYMECYDLSYSDEKKLIVKNIMNEKNRNYINDLEMILEHHIIDKKSKDMLQEMINKILYFADENKFDVEGSTYMEEQKQKEVKAISFTGIIDPTPESIDKNVDFSADDFNDVTAVTITDLSEVQIKVQFQNRDRVIVDEALFATSNVKRAVYDYLSKEAFIKKMGLYLNGKDVFLYASKNTSLSVPILTEEMKKIKNVSYGARRELVEFYEEKIRKTMVEMTS